MTSTLVSHFVSSPRERKKTLSLNFSEKKIRVSSAAVVITALRTKLWVNLFILNFEQVMIDQLC